MARSDQYTQINKKSEVYSDFMTDLNTHPATGQVVRKTNEEAVKRALRNLIMTNRYERPFNPGFGGNIRKYLFEPMTPQTAFSIKEEIENMIKNFEKRVRVHDVVVSGLPDESAYLISIVFSVRTSTSPVQMDVTLYRVR